MKYIGMKGGEEVQILYLIYVYYILNTWSKHEQIIRLQEACLLYNGSW